MRVDEYLNNDGFSCIIVYGLHQQRKYNETLAEERIKESLTTWITENDFQGIQALGFNSVRLPVGYWNVMDDPYKLFVPKNYHESLYYIDWCFDMADRWCVAVLCSALFNELEHNTHGLDESFYVF